MDILLIIALLVLQGLDIYTTYKVISSGKGYEANPVIAWVIAKLGLLRGLITAKVVIFIPCIFLFWFIHLAAPITLLIMLGVLVLIYSWVVYNNYKILTA